MKTRFVKKAILNAILGTGVVMASNAALAVDYNGYFRANTGSNSGGGGQTCFGLAGAGSKYRLGNECGVYGELQLGNEIARTDDGSVFRATAMFNVVNGVSGNATLGTSGGTGTANGSIGLPQLYLSAQNVPELGGATGWMGRRYYKREDVHITDFFYWNPANNEGLGGGIEDLPVGNGMKFSYALFRDDISPNTPAYNTTASTAPNTIDAPTVGVSNGKSETRHDLQLRGLGVNPGGNLEFGLSLISKDSKQANTNNGSMITIQHRQAGILGGENKLAFQHASGSSVHSNGGGAGSFAALAYGSDVKESRVVEALHFQPTAQFGGQVIAVYDKVSANDVTIAQTWTTLGGRIAYGLSAHVKLLADLGHDTVKPGNGGADAQLTKYTLALALSQGSGYYARPELRVFYTHASWNGAAQAAAAANDPLSTTGAFGTNTSGSVIGFTAESWW